MSTEKNVISSVGGQNNINNSVEQYWMKKFHLTQNQRSERNKQQNIGLYIDIIDGTSISKEKVKNGKEAHLRKKQSAKNPSETTLCSYESFSKEKNEQNKNIVHDSTDNNTSKVVKLGSSHVIDLSKKAMEEPYISRPNNPQLKDSPKFTRNNEFNLQISQCSQPQQILSIPQSVKITEGFIENGSMRKTTIQKNNTSVSTKKPRTSQGMNKISGKKTSNKIQDNSKITKDMHPMVSIPLSSDSMKQLYTNSPIKDTNIDKNSSEQSLQLYRKKLFINDNDLVDPNDKPTNSGKLSTQLKNTSNQSLETLEGLSVQTNEQLAAKTNNRNTKTFLDKNVTEDLNLKSQNSAPLNESLQKKTKSTRLREVQQLLCDIENNVHIDNFESLTNDDTNQHEGRRLRRLTINVERAPLNVQRSTESPNLIPKTNINLEKFNLVPRVRLNRATVRKYFESLSAKQSSVQDKVNVTLPSISNISTNKKKEQDSTTMNNNSRKRKATKSNKFVIKVGPNGFTRPNSKRRRLSLNEESSPVVIDGENTKGDAVVMEPEIKMEVDESSDNSKSINTPEYRDVSKTITDANNILSTNVNGSAKNVTDRDQLETDTLNATIGQQAATSATSLQLSVTHAQCARPITSTITTSSKSTRNSIKTPIAKGVTPVESTVASAIEKSGSKPSNIFQESLQKQIQYIDHLMLATINVTKKLPTTSREQIMEMLLKSNKKNSIDIEKIVNFLRMYAKAAVMILSKHEKAKTSLPLASNGTSASTVITTSTITVANTPRTISDIPKNTVSEVPVEINSKNINRNTLPIKGKKNAVNNNVSNITNNAAIISQQIPPITSKAKTVVAQTTKKSNVNGDKACTLKSKPRVEVKSKSPLTNVARSKTGSKVISDKTTRPISTSTSTINDLESIIPTITTPVRINPHNLTISKSVNVYTSRNNQVMGKTSSANESGMSTANYVMTPVTSIYSSPTSGLSRSTVVIKPTNTGTNNGMDNIPLSQLKGSAQHHHPNARNANVILKPIMVSNPVHQLVGTSTTNLQPQSIASLQNATSFTGTQNTQSKSVRNMNNISSSTPHQYVQVATISPDVASILVNNPNVKMFPSNSNVGRTTTTSSHVDKISQSFSAGGGSTSSNPCTITAKFHINGIPTNFNVPGDNSNIPTQCSQSRAIPVDSQGKRMSQGNKSERRRNAKNTCSRVDYQHTRVNKNIPVSEVPANTSTNEVTTKPKIGTIRIRSDINGVSTSSRFEENKSAAEAERSPNVCQNIELVKNSHVGDISTNTDPRSINHHQPAVNQYRNVEIPLNSHLDKVSPNIHSNYMSSIPHVNEVMLNRRPIIWKYITANGEIRTRLPVVNNIAGQPHVAGYIESPLNSTLLTKTNFHGTSVNPHVDGGGVLMNPEVIRKSVNSQFGGITTSSTTSGLLPVSPQFGRLPINSHVVRTSVNPHVITTSCSPHDIPITSNIIGLRGANKHFHGINSGPSPPNVGPSTHLLMPQYQQIMLPNVATNPPSLEHAAAFMPANQQYRAEIFADKNQQAVPNALQQRVSK